MSNIVKTVSGFKCSDVKVLNGSITARKLSHKGYYTESVKFIVIKYTYTHIHIYICMCMCMCVCIYIYICMCVISYHNFISIYTYIFKYDVCMYMYVCMYVCGYAHIHTSI